MSEPFRKYGYYLSSIVRLLTGFQNPARVLRLFLKIPLSTPCEIRLRKSGIHFLVRGPMDVWIIKETWLDRFYERYGVPMGRGWTVIDVGAGIGDFAIYAAWKHPNNVVYAFEPFPESFQLLQDNLRLNEITNVHAFDQAIAAHTGTASLDLSGSDPLQFGTARRSDRQICVPALSLADALEKIALTRCDLLKMDCEGAEYDILFHAPDGVLERVAHLVMEYHDGVTPHTHTDLVHFLERRGFQVRTHPNPVHAHLGFLYAFRPEV